MNLHVGGLVHLVTVQSLSDSIGGSGFPIESASTLCQAWMSKQMATGREAFSSGQMSASIQTEWWMRYRDDMDPDLVDVPKKRRLSYQGRIYDITSASVEGRKEAIRLTTLASSKA